MMDKVIKIRCDNCGHIPCGKCDKNKTVTSDGEVGELKPFTVRENLDGEYGITAYNRVLAEITWTFGKKDKKQHNYLGMPVFHENGKPWYVGEPLPKILWGIEQNFNMQRIILHPANETSDESID